MATEENTRHLPKGTLEELREARMDPSMYGCCHANASDSNGIAIMGCHVEKSCPFADKKFGGFKGDAPEYVGYYHRTARADGSKEMENVVPCHVFVQTLLRRMRKGMADKEERRDYEHIEIIALPKHVLERDPSLKRRFTDTISVVRWSSEVHKSLVNMNLVPESVEMEVPRHPRPMDRPNITHTQKLRSRAEAREAARARDGEHQDPETREERLARIKAELAEMDSQLPAEPAADVALVAAEEAEAFVELPAPSGQAPVAQPVPPKAKR